MQTIVVVAADLAGCRIKLNSATRKPTNIVYEGDTQTFRFRPAGDVTISHNCDDPDTNIGVSYVMVATVD